MPKGFLNFFRRYNFFYRTRGANDCYGISGAHPGRGPCADVWDLTYALAHPSGLQKEGTPVPPTSSVFLLWIFEGTMSEILILTVLNNN